MTDGEKQANQEEILAVETAWAEAMKNGVPANSKALDTLLKRHRHWVSMMWDRPCPPAAYAGLADMHQSHPDFVKRYETIAPGFSDYHAEPMKAYAKRLAGYLIAADCCGLLSVVCCLWMTVMNQNNMASAFEELYFLNLGNNRTVFSLAIASTSVAAKLT